MIHKHSRKVEVIRNRLRSGKQLFSALILGFISLLLHFALQKRSELYVWATTINQNRTNATVHLYIQILKDNDNSV